MRFLFDDVPAPQAAIRVTSNRVPLSILCWCFAEGGTPVLFPNTAVKPLMADGSRKARVGRRQHRVLISKHPGPSGPGCFW